jgi:hypothetical protein
LATATKSLAGQDQPITSPLNRSPAQTLSLGSGLNQVNEPISYIQSVGIGSTLNLDLTTLTDILQVTNINLTIIKAILIELLSPTQDGSGTLASSISIGAAAANPWSTGPFGATDTQKIFNGGLYYATNFSAAGFPVDATHKVLKIVNNDAGLAASVRITILGST